jgi:hypothetical protein
MQKLIVNQYRRWLFFKEIYSIDNLYIGHNGFYPKRRDMN